MITLDLYVEYIQQRSSDAAVAGVSVLFQSSSGQYLVFIILRVTERLAGGDGDALRQAFAEVPVGDVPAEARASAHGGRDGVGAAQAGGHSGLERQSLHG